MRPSSRSAGKLCRFEKLSGRLARGLRTPLPQPELSLYFAAWSSPGGEPELADLHPLYRCRLRDGLAARAFKQGREEPMLKVKLPDGSVKEFRARVRPTTWPPKSAPVGQSRDPGRSRWQGRRRPRPLPTEGEVSLRLLTKKDPEALAVMRHRRAHVMARAVMRLFDGVQLAFGPTTETGFYYDFELPHAALRRRLPAIEAEMQKIIKADEPFERLEVPRDEAVDLCRDLEQKLKVEHIERRPRRREDA